VNGKKDDNHQYALSTTLEGLTAELDFGVALGNMNNTGVGVVVHPGSRKDKPAGLVMVSSSIVEVLTRKTRESEKIAESLGITPKAVRRRRKIILENAAGEGSKLCSTLEEIHTVIEGVPEKLRDQVKVCIDTAHAFGKGLYDWGVKGEIARFYDDFDRIIGLEHLEVFHFNDSMKSEDNRKNAPFGSRKDRHQNLGLGYIFGGDERFKEIHTFITSALELGIPVIGEPPGKGIDDWDVIAAITLNDENPLDVRYDPKD
jgi:endonuclease IV